MKAAAHALAENPSWARMPKEWQRVALWAYRYVEEPVPTRNDIAKALISGANVRGRQGA
jgi:hypothetical protein